MHLPAGQPGHLCDRRVVAGTPRSDGRHDCRCLDEGNSTELNPPEMTDSRVEQDIQVAKGARCDH